MEKECLSFLMDHIIKVILKRMRQKTKKEFLYLNSYNILGDSYKIDSTETAKKKELLIHLLDNMQKENGLEEHLNGQIIVLNILILVHLKISYFME